MPPENECDKCGHRSYSDRFWYIGPQMICDICNNEYAVFRGIAADALLCLGGHIKLIRKRVSV